MRTIYRTYFQLTPKLDLTFDAVRSKVLHWALGQPTFKEIGNIDFTTDSGQQRGGPGCFIESRYYSGSHGQAWGIRLTNPETDSDVMWISETTIHHNHSNQIWVSCSLSVGREGHSLTPIARQPNRPRVVKDILSAFPGEGILPLTPQGYVCATPDTPLLLRLLESPSRHLPVVFVSATRDGFQFKRYNKLSNLLCGLAYVVVAESADVSYELGKSLPERLNCFDGGVRIYWPHFSTKDHPFDHPLWTKQKIIQLTETHPTRLEKIILNRIAEVSVFTSSPSFVSWSKIIEWQRANAIEKAKASNDLTQLLELFENDNRDLAAQVKQLTRELDAKAQEASKYKSQAETYRQILEKNGGKQARQTLEISIATVKDALAIARNELSDRIAFAWNSKSEDEESPFEKPEQVLQALRWLGDVYYRAKIGEQRCEDFDLSVRNAVEGWSYEPHQSKNTMRNSKFRDWYHTLYERKEFSLPEHLKCGSTKDARHSIRIGFNWCPNTRRVVLGYLGQHQETSAS